MTFEVSRLVRDQAVRGENEEETTLLREIVHSVQEYVAGFRWCQETHAIYLGLGIGDVVGVSLVWLVPRVKDADECIWVIVRDIPPLYLTIEVAPDPGTALRVYIELMREWVQVVREDGSLADVVPVDAPPTTANADALASRLAFLEQEVLPRYYHFDDFAVAGRPGTLADPTEEGCYDAFLRTCRTQGHVWGLERDGKWAVTEGICCEDALALWSRKDVAQRAGRDHWRDKRIKAIPLGELVEEWLPDVAEQQLPLRLFEGDEESAPVAALRLQRDLANPDGA